MIIIIPYKSLPGIDVSLEASDRRAKELRLGGFPELGVRPYNKDYRIIGSVLGSPHFGKMPFVSLLSA